MPASIKGFPLGMQRFAHVKLRKLPIGGRVLRPQRSFLDTRLLRMGAVWGLLIIAFTILCLLANAQPTIIDGDWIIDTDTTLRDGTWEVMGSITISNANLTLDHAILIMNASWSGGTIVKVGVSSRLDSTHSRILGGDLGFCIEIDGDAVLLDTELVNSDRLYHGYGIYQLGGNTSFKNCTFDGGLNFVWSASNLEVKSCMFINFSGEAITWEFQGGTLGKVCSMDDSSFRNLKVQGTGILVYGSYMFEPGGMAMIRNCTFHSLLYCIYAYSFEDFGSLLIEYNKSFNCTNGLLLYEDGSATLVRFNVWDVPSIGIGIFVYSRGNDTPLIHNETVNGGKTGIVVSGQGQTLTLWNIFINKTYSIGIECSQVNLIIHDSVFDTYGFSLFLRGSTFIHLFDCRGQSGYVQGDGEILELTTVNVTLVRWQEGTPIDEGVTIFESETGFQLAEMNNSAPSRIEIPVWVVRQNFNTFIDSVRGAYHQGCVTFYSDMFPIHDVESIALVIYDRFVPELIVATPTDGAKLRQGTLLVSGSILEMGIGMGTVMVRCTGIDWQAAELTGRGEWNLTLTGLPDGRLDVNVNATDRANNSVQVDVGNIIIDTVLPPIDVLSPPDQVRTTPVELVVMTEPGSTAYVNYRTVDLTEGGMFSALIVLYEGENGVLITVDDAVGNRNETVYVVVLDTVAPTLRVTSPEDGMWTREQSVWVNGTTEPSAHVRVDGLPVNSSEDGAFSTLVIVMEGSSAIDITAEDTAGNIAIIERTIRVDRTAPVLEVLEPVDGCVTAARALTIVGRVSDASPVVVLVQGYPAAVTGGRWFKEIALAEGSNSVVFEALDEAGNEAGGQIEVILDTRPPVLEVTLSVGNRTYIVVRGPIVTNDDEATFAFDADERGYVEVEGRTPFEAGTGTVEKSYLMVEGTNEFRFVMRDVAGNAGTTLVFMIELDTMAPSLLVTHPKGGAIIWEEQVRLMGVTEPGAEVIIAGVIPIQYINGSFEATVPLEIGTNSIVVEVRDAANNSAKYSLQVVRMQRDTLTPADGGTSLLIGLVCLLIGFTVSFAVLWVIRQRRRQMMIGDQHQITEKHSRTGSSTPREPGDDVLRKGGQE